MMYNITTEYEENMLIWHDGIAYSFLWKNSEAKRIFQKYLN